MHHVNIIYLHIYIYKTSQYWDLNQIFLLLFYLFIYTLTHLSELHICVYTVYAYKIFRNMKLCGMYVV